MYIPAYAVHICTWIFVYLCMLVCTCLFLSILTNVDAPRFFTCMLVEDPGDATANGVLKKQLDDKCHILNCSVESCCHSLGVCIQGRKQGHRHNVKPLKWRYLWWMCWIALLFSIFHFYRVGTTEKIHVSKQALCMCPLWPLSLTTLIMVTNC